MGYGKMAMIKVTAYQCEYCKKAFMTATHHGVCKHDPNVQNCGSCIHHYQPHEFMRYLPGGEEEEWDPIRHYCRKQHDNHIPRKLNCPDYAESDPQGDERTTYHPDFSGNPDTVDNTDDYLAEHIRETNRDEHVY